MKYVARLNFRIGRREFLAGHSYDGGDVAMLLAKGLIEEIPGGQPVSAPGPDPVAVAVPEEEPAPVAEIEPAPLEITPKKAKKKKG